MYRSGAGTCKQEHTDFILPIVSTDTSSSYKVYTGDCMFEHDVWEVVVDLVPCNGYHTACYILRTASVYSFMHCLAEGIQ